MFLKCRRYTLTDNKRCKDAHLHEVQVEFRKGNPEPLHQFLLDHRLRDSDADKFACAPIISPGNEERTHFNPAALKQFAKAHGRRVITWNLDVFVKGTHVPFRVVTDRLADKDQLEAALQAFVDRNPSTVASFCEGAPVYMLTNINPLLGLANGVNAWLYSLEWSSPDIRHRALEFIKHTDGDHVHLPDELVPTAVLVRASIRPSLRSSWPPQLSVVPGDVVIPVEYRRIKVKLNTGGLHKQRGTVQTPQYDFAFLRTIHKAQSCTYTHPFIINLLRRSGKPGQPDFHGLVVAVSRGTQGDDLRAIYNDGDIDYILHLLPPVELLAFEEGWDEHGNWNFARCRQALHRIQQERKPPPKTHKDSAPASAHETHKRHPSSTAAAHPTHASASLILQPALPHVCIPDNTSTLHPAEVTAIVHASSPLELPVKRHSSPLTHAQTSKKSRRSYSDETNDNVLTSDEDMPTVTKH